ncbi:outer membrane lipid asymmetry maintenance protein MlaD [Halovulum dunhuangense]|uniref:Outer membrane lipid asymmetry maintenance protein MlaD n=1 Tax=Halovulum dunhuangense TaxID=1505036 RepID=A0A849L2T2_9RHOB|nr:outer membrane lipid asymmetry maintenance protein MlaD [Halovulum dunhuangense]NNU80668.1 outer membrane lipid asymmetry maintenance protein MlaD [Halovulum dunhuangense]
MANSVTETLLGAGVLLVAGGFLFVANQSADLFGDGDGRYALRASFTSAEGVSVGTDVRMAGVKIGSVTGLNLNPDTYRADLVFTVDDGIMVPDDSDVKIASEGLLGGSYVELTPGGSEFMLAEGDEILLTQSSVSFLNLMMRFVTNDTGETE